MARTPAVTAAIVVTLALGIGANTAIFSLLNAVMFRALPVEDPSQLMLLQWSANHAPRFTGYANYGETKRLPLLQRGMSNPRGESFSHPFLEEVEKSGVFSGVAAFAGSGQLTMSGEGLTTYVNAQGVNGDFFRTLGIRAAVGRVLDTSDDLPSSGPALVLNYGYWQRALGASPSVVGKIVNLGGVPFTIAGVAEQRFVSLSFGNVYDVWVPAAKEPGLDAKMGGADPKDPALWWLVLAARLKPEVSAAQGQAAMNVLFRNHVLHGGKPLLKEEDAPRINLLPAREALVGASGQFTDPLRVLLVAVSLILLIACANAAGLLLCRATGRSREVAVRLALGARRGRLLRQALTESVVMGLLAGVLGLILAFWGARVIVAIVATNRPRPLGLTATIDGRVLAFTTAISLLTGILFGLAPAIRSLRADLTPTLKGDGGNAEARRRWYGMGNILVLLQAALAVVVMAGAGLLLHSLTNLRNLDPGFDTRSTLTFGLSPRLAGYKGRQIDNLYRDLRREIGAMPGVSAVSYSIAPLLSGRAMRMTIRNLPPGSNSNTSLDVVPVGPGFFDTLKIPTLAGRTLSQADVESGSTETSVPLPVVASRMLAEKFFPGRNAVGQRFGENAGSDPHLPEKSPGFVIVGVAGNAKTGNLRSEIQPTLYVPLAGQNAAFEVRTTGDPKAMIPAIRELIGRHNRNLPMIKVLTESEQIDRQLEQERLVARLSGFFGILALLLACVGLYGLLAYGTIRRTREIGVRMALGARRADVVRMVMWQGLALAGVGTVLGLIAAVATGHWFGALLYRVKTTDPVTLGVVALLMMIVAALATFVPARRAALVDPAFSLRCE